jgi:hypothetical protein
MTPETGMLSPLPRGPPRSMPTSPITYAPSEDVFKGLGDARSFWYDVEDEAARDLQEVMGCKMLPDWIPAFPARCSSVASTYAPSSPPPSISQPLSPVPTLELSPFSPVPTVVRSELSSESPAPHCPPGALDKSSWLQARKVFVGGIPQTIDQNALYHMFSKIGKVKKAWVQLFHADHDRVPAGKHHRGFGFVIFHEKHSIDQLLGEDSQRFICFVTT